LVLKTRKEAEEWLQKGEDATGMLALKRGDKVYAVKWVDLPHLAEPIPMLRQYQVTKMGEKFMEAREIYIGKLAGQLGNKDSGSIHYLAKRYSRTRSAALSLAISAEVSRSEGLERQLKESARRIALLRELVEANLPETAVPGEHCWLSPTQMKANFPNLDSSISSCAWCGVVQRKDGKPNKPCLGVVHVALRGVKETDES
jgi:hypothetical protein